MEQKTGQLQDFTGKPISQGRVIGKAAPSTQTQIIDNLKKVHPDWSYDQTIQYAKDPNLRMKEAVGAFKSLVAADLSGGVKNADAHWQHAKQMFGIPDGTPTPQVGAAPQQNQQGRPPTTDETAAAKSAIAAGKDRNLVLQRLKEHGIAPPEGL
jgi:hypothetical protein